MPRGDLLVAAAAAADDPPLLDEVNLLAGGTAAGCRPDNLHVSPLPFFASTWEVSASADGQAIRW